MSKVFGLIKWLLSSREKTVIAIVLLLVAGYFGYKHFITKTPTPQYQTTQVQKGTLITSISASGQITTANNVSVTIQASGVVKEVLVKNGDKVIQGQALATLTLDQASQQKQASAHASYLSAKNSLDSANVKVNSLQAALFKANQTFINDAVAKELKTDDPTYIQEHALWLMAEADYKAQATAITAAQSSFAAASLNLSQLSSTITAPVSGKVFGLTITPGAIITLSSGSSTSTSTSQVLGSINQPGPIQTQVNLSEIDSVSVSEGQKATMTLDAFPNKTFTGKVVSINTNGTVSSGVTTYPAVIAFDSGIDHMYPNMGVNATIITKVKNDVLLVPSGTIQTQNGQSSVRILKNGQIQTIPVEVGDSSSTQVEIISGINEGDMVVTSIATPTQSTSDQNSSPFGAGARGGVFRTMGGGR